MNLYVLIIIGVVLGALSGLCTTFLFKKLPESWLQDYGVKETDPNYRVSKRMRIMPEGLIAGVISALFYIAFAVFCKANFIDAFKPVHVAAIVLLVPVLVLVMMADKLNRIIPDQFSIVIAVLGILLMISDYTEGSVWFSAQARWYIPLLNRILGALIGGGILWLIGFLTLTFTGRDGMGQGDMRLLAACGLITGCYGLVILIYVAVFSALIFAIPLIIRKQRRLKKEEEMIRNSANPRKTRRALEIKKARMHFADDPDYLAFGPFLALGCGVFAVMEPFFFAKMSATLSVLGVLF
ncbi:MAG: A24 family peptidase [Saccharofermentans sp.]|nr:A24 family peptidase [Saccharofermentans sp.]